MGEIEMTKKFENVDSIIFDLDGTLWDSRKEVAESWSEVLAKYNYNRKSISFQEVNDLMGKTIDEIEDLLFPEIPKEKRTAIMYQSGENEINYLEIFSCDFAFCLEKMMSNKVFTIKPKYKITEEQLIEWCLNNPLPGNNKWEANHPIWKCYVSGQPSPYDAWSDEKCIRKAVKNFFQTLDRCINESKEDSFVKRHLCAINSCIIENNKIISSDKRLLELVLARFTIAKIASKVTAISPTDCMNIFDESGIDLSKYNGIYVPMAGFGGIVEGYKRWLKKNDSIDKISNIEAYDINKSFCDWYGWKQRDVLESIIETDKICIV